MYAVQHLPSYGVWHGAVMQRMSVSICNVKDFGSWLLTEMSKEEYDELCAKYAEAFPYKPKGKLAIWKKS